MKRTQAALAGALVVAAHLVVLLILGLPRPTVESRETADTLPPVQLFLLRPEVQRSPPTENLKAPPAPPSAAPSVLSVPAPQAPLVSTPKPAAPLADADMKGDQMKGALRGLLGCSSVMAARVNADEQRVCDRRLAEARPTSVGPLYSVEEAAAFNENRESIFTRKPHNECLPHIGNGDTPGGSSAASTTFGIACAWSF